MSLRRFITTRCTVRDHTAVDLEAEDVYRILAAHRRRLMLPLLADLEGEEIAQAELARRVASEETGAAPLDVPPDAYEAAYVALYQSHLPVLERFDVVEWDCDAGLVRPGPSLPGLAEVVQEIERRTRG